MKTPLQGRATDAPPVVAIVGPTAVGKTALAVRLAEATGGEIISADSRQVYRGMDIGTAKAAPKERERVPHHLLDVVDPDRPLSLAEFLDLAHLAVEGILACGHVPFVVGGTGQYVMAMVEGWQVPQVPPAPSLRSELFRMAEELGAESLHLRLEALDPVAAGRIDARNVRRVVRALEVCLSTGRPFSELQAKLPSPYRWLLIGLSLPRAELYRRIDERIDQMIAAGLEEEVRRLVVSGYGFDLPAMSSVGYGQFRAYLAGRASPAETVLEIKRVTRRFVRHQSNWFRADDPRIHWFDCTQDPFEPALDLVRGFLLVSRPG